MKRRIVALLLCLLMIVQLVPVTAVAEDVAAPVCDQGCNAETVGAHQDSCAVKVYYRDLFTGSTADTIYAMKGQLPADAWEYILNVGWQLDNAKRMELDTLLKEGETPADPAPTEPTPAAPPADPAPVAPPSLTAPAPEAETGTDGIPACSGAPTCWGETNGEPMKNHVDTCARKAYLITFVQGNDAKSIAALWDSFTEKEQADIMSIVEAYTTYAEELKALVENGSGDDDDDDDDEVVTVNKTVNGQTITVSGNGLPENAELNISDTIPGMDGGFAYDISINADGEEWQPADGDTVSLTLSVPGAVEGEYVEIVHFLEEASAIQAAIAKGNVLAEDWVSSIYPAAAAAYQTATGVSGAVAYEVFKPQVIGGKVTLEVSGFSIYSWSGSSYSSINAGTSNAYKIIFHDTVTSDADPGGPYFVTVGQRIYCDRGGIAVINRQWRFSSGAALTASNDLTGADGAEINFLVGNMSIGTSFYIECRVWQGFGWTSWHRVNFVVVEERPVHFNANGRGTAPGTLTAVTDNGSRVQRVTLPNINVTGYRLTGWNTKADGTGTSYAVGSAYLPPSGGITLYAQWAPITYTVNYHANGGGGSMASQTMTYDKQTPLNLCKFTQPKAGHMFGGWATTEAKADAGTIDHFDGASVKNLANTQNATVNLYAVWVDVFSVSEIRMAVNECYWYTDYQYTVSADGVASSSYHAFPNEPAIQSIRYMRPIDKTGAWTITGDDTLKSNAFAYVDSSILNSQHFVKSYKTDQNVWGVSDPNGVTTKAFLKLSTQDYQNITKAWLQNMADRTADSASGGVYAITNKNVTYHTDVNWNAEVDKWQEYEVIPYVIKLEYNSNQWVWRIDTVIAPTRNVTLSYDLNINTAAGYSLTGGSSIPSAQYGRDTVVNVLESPKAYNANTKVTKVQNGVTYTAVFQYWEDEQGVKYGKGENGTTYNGTLTMNGNKSLKAIWYYPDQTEGALRLSKQVTVPAGSGLTPDTSKAFTLKAEFDKAGNYSYSKYSASGIIAEMGTTSGTSASFSLKSGEYVIISGIPASTNYTVSETAATGYTNKTGGIGGLIQAGNTMPATIVNERNAYTVTWKNWDGTVLETDTFVEHGTSASYGGAEPQRPTDNAYVYDFTGWDKGTNGVISNVTQDITVTAQYSNTPVTHTVTASVSSNGTASPATQSVKHGESGTVTFTANTGYKIAYIMDGTTKVDITDAASYTYTVSNVTADRTVVAYTVADTYPVTYNANGGTGAPAAQTKTHNVTLTLSSDEPIRDGYEFNSWNTKSDGTGTAYAPSGSYTGNAPLNLYAKWDPEQYTITYDANGGSAVDPQTYDIEDDVTLAADSTKEGYDFIGWKLSSAVNTWQAKTYGAEENVGTGKYGDITLVAQWNAIKYPVTFHHYLEGTTTKLHEDTSDNIAYGTKVSVANYAQQIANHAVASCDPAQLEVKVSGNEAIIYYKPLTASYTIKVYKQQVTGNGYDMTSKTEVGNIGATVSANPTDYVETGFTFVVGKSTASGEITADGGLVLELYFDRVLYKVTYEYTGTVPEGAPEVPAQKEYRYGAKATAENAPTLTGYEFSGWNQTGEFLVYDHMTVTGSWTANTDAWYLVHYYLENTTESLQEDKREEGKTFGESYTETAPAIPGYTPVKESQSVTAGYENNVITFLYRPNTDTKYKVEHYLRHYSNNTPELKDTDNLTGTTGAETQAEAKDYPGYTAAAFEQLEIAGDGSTVVKIYYDEQPVTVNYHSENEAYGTVNPAAEGPVGAATGEISGSVPTAKDGFKFVGWYEDSACTEPVDSSLVDADGKLTPVKVDGLNVAADYYAKFAPVESQITIVMHVDGKYANLKMPFTGTLNWNHYEGSPQTRTSEAYELKNGESETVTVQAGSSFSLSDMLLPDTYAFVKAVYKDVTDTDMTGGKVENDGFVLTEGESELHIYYKAIDVTETGLYLGNAGAIAAILAVCAGLIVIYVIGRRRRRNED